MKRSPDYYRPSDRDDPGAVLVQFVLRSGDLAHNGLVFEVAVDKLAGKVIPGRTFNLSGVVMDVLAVGYEYASPVVHVSVH